LFRVFQAAKKLETNRLNKKRKTHVQAKASPTSNSDSDGDNEEGEEGIEEVVVVEVEAPPKTKVYITKCWEYFHKPKTFPDGNKYVVCKLCPPTKSSKEVMLKYNGGTSSLIKYLVCKHKGEYMQNPSTGDKMQVGVIIAPSW
jgi:hypothetical protein